MSVVALVPLIRVGALASVAMVFLWASSLEKSVGGEIILMIILSAGGAATLARSIAMCAIGPPAMNIDLPQKQVYFRLARTAGLMYFLAGSILFLAKLTSG
jgi:hypothetical protein